MGALLGVTAGIGLLLIVLGSGGTTTRRRRERGTGVAGKVNERLAGAGMGTVSPPALLAVSAGAAVLVALLVLVLTGSVAVSMVFAAFGAAAPWWWIGRLHRRRQDELRELWPEVVDNLTSGVRAGLSLPEALAAVGDRGPEQLREPFRRFGSDYRTTGQFHRSLDTLKATLADPVGDRVCESLRMARDVGGTDLGRLLSTLSEFLRQDARTRAELASRQSWTLNAARLAVAAPWAVLLLLATRQETLSAYDTPTGTMILVGGAVLTVAAYRLMLRIGRLPEERRVLQ